jgi:lactam utilization protein B
MDLSRTAGGFRMNQHQNLLRLLAFAAVATGANAGKRREFGKSGET